MKARIVLSGLIKPPLIPLRRLRGGFMGILSWLACSWLFSQEAPTVPEWWQTRGVLKEGAAAVDYAPANLGQLKNFARAATEEMRAKGCIETGHPLDSMVQSWIDNTDAARDYSPANLGQLKAVAKPFYDRLIELGMLPPNSYPWSASTRPASDYSLTNLGQLKAVFNFVVLDPDVDADGISDVWEMQIVTANNGDSITTVAHVRPLDDFDGDRVPNLWEYSRQTNPTDAASAPVPDAVVEDGEALLPAYSSLPGGDYRAVIWVKRGHHPGAVPFGQMVTRTTYEVVGTQPTYSIDEWGNEYPDGGCVIVWDFVTNQEFVLMEPKKVLWLGELGASRLEGLEAAVVDPGVDGMVVSNDCVIDGLIFDGKAVPRASPAMTVLENSRVRLVNCIIRHCSGASIPGALFNAGGDVELLHVTVHQSNGTTSDPLVMGPAITQSLGSLVVSNSILWDTRSTSAQQAIAGIPDHITLLSSLAQGGMQSSINTPPQLSAGGYLTADSAACMDVGSPSLLPRDLHAEARSGTSPDLGADEWLNADAAVGDHLPDWWEQWWFGSLTPVDGDDSDVDAVGNLAEYAAATPPTADQDGDGLRDDWEKSFWNRISTHDGNDNPDDDERDNLAEQTDGFDPTVVDPDSDKDHDTLLDVWEILHWGNIGAQAGGDNPDDDERSNFEEQRDGYNPKQMDADSDKDKDGLWDVWEFTHWGDRSATPGGNPDSDGRSNLQEQTQGTNPTQMDADFDDDQDGLMDVWEIQHWGDITAWGAAGDPDGDLMNNLLEQELRTNPTQYNWAGADSDFDGLQDLFEWKVFKSLHETKMSDFDGDGRTNAQEIAHWSGLALLFGWDLQADLDGDNLSLIEELMLGTSPVHADTDGDLVRDDLDRMPLDILVGITAVNVAGAPVLTLVAPPGATPVP